LCLFCVPFDHTPYQYCLCHSCQSQVAKNHLEIRYEKMKMSTRQTKDCAAATGFWLQVIRRMIRIQTWALMTKTHNTMSTRNGQRLAADPICLSGTNIGQNLISHTTVHMSLTGMSGCQETELAYLSPAEPRLQRPMRLPLGGVENGLALGFLLIGECLMAFLALPNSEARGDVLRCDRIGEECDGELKPKWQMVISTDHSSNIRTIKAFLSTEESCRRTQRKRAGILFEPPQRITRLANEITRARKSGHNHAHNDEPGNKFVRNLT